MDNKKFLGHGGVWLPEEILEAMPGRTLRLVVFLLTGKEQELVDQGREILVKQALMSLNRTRKKK